MKLNLSAHGGSNENHKSVSFDSGIIWSVSYIATVISG